MSDETVHTVAEWTESPFTAHDRRFATVHHRVRVVHTPGVGTDVLHEVRSTDTDELPAEWTAAERVEGRPHGLSVTESRDGWFA